MSRKSARVQKAFSRVGGELYLCIVLILAGILFTFTACENFLNGAETKKELEDAIAYANANSCRVYLSQDSGYGSFLSGSQLNCKVGYDTQVQFTLKSQSSIFKGLTAVSTADKAVSRNDCVEIKTLGSDDEKGVYKLSIKVIKAAGDILIEPVCHEYPSVASYSPQYSSNGVVSNSVIQCDFNVELDPLAQGSVSIFCGGEDITSLYKEPELSEDKKAIIIKPVSSEISSFIKNKGVGFIDITVSLSPAITSTQDGEVYNLIQNGKSSFQLRLNPVIDNNAPAFIPDSFKAAASRQAMEEGTYYDLSYKWDESSEIPNKAIDSVFFSFDVYENESSIAYIKIREQAVASKGYIPTIGDNAKEFKSNSDPQDTTVAYPFKDFTYTENNSVYSYDFEYQLQTKKELFVRLEITAYDEAGHATASQQLDFCKYNIVKDDVKFFIYNKALVPNSGYDKNILYESYPKHSKNDFVDESAIQNYFKKNADGSSDAVFNLRFYLEPVNDSLFANTKNDYTFEYAASKSMEGLESQDFVSAEVTHGDSDTIKIHISDISSDTYIKLRAIDKYGFYTDNIFLIPGEAIPLFYCSLGEYSGYYRFLDFYEDTKDNINNEISLFIKSGSQYFPNKSRPKHTFEVNSREFYTQKSYKSKFEEITYYINGPCYKIDNISTYRSSEVGKNEPTTKINNTNNEIECTFDFSDIYTKNPDIQKIFIVYDYDPYFSAYLDVTAEGPKTITKVIPTALFQKESSSGKYYFGYKVWYIKNTSCEVNNDYFKLYVGTDKPQGPDTTPPKISFGTKAELTKSFFFKDENYDWTSSSKVKVQYASDSYEAELLLPVIELTHNDGYSVDVPVRQIPVGEYCDITLTVSDKYGNVSQATQEHVNVRKDFTYDFDPDFNFNGKKEYKFRVANDELKSKEKLSGQYVYLNNLRYEIQGEDYDIDVFYLDSTSGKAEWKKYAGPVHAGGGASDDDYIIDQIAYGAFLKLNTVKFYRINYTNSIYEYQDSAPKYMRAGSPVSVAVKDILELTNGVQVYSSKNVLIHTLYGPFDYGDNIDDWEYHCEHTELNLVYETADHSQTPYYYTIPASKVPSGMYYTTIIYFADNTALKTKVRHAQ